MADSGLTAVGLTRRGMAEAEDGNLDAARQNFAEALHLNQQYEPAWLWFASVARTDGERRFCLEQAVAINEDSAARVQLARLRRVEPEFPEELEGIVDPPPPPDLSGKLFREASKRDRRRVWWLVAGAALLLLAAGLVALVRASQSSTAGQPLTIAVAVPLSGDSAAQGREIVDSVRMFVDQANRDGGVNGRPLAVMTYDDHGDADRAVAVANQIVADDKALLVIGHTLSGTSLAAGPIYAKAGIPMITPSATSPRVTAENPWAFRMLFDNTTEGLLLATYAHGQLGADHLTVIHGSSDYGRTLATGVAKGADGVMEIRQTIEVDTEHDGATTAASIAAAVAKVKADKDPGPIALLMSVEPARQTVIALRQAGVKATIVGGDSIASNGFLRSLVDAPAEQANAGSVGDGLIVASPLVLDSLTSEALRWYNAFKAAYDDEPDWRGAIAYNSALVSVHGIRQAMAEGAEDLPAQRAAIRDSLEGMTSPETGIAGILGPVYFDATRSAVQAVEFGVAHNGEFSSVPVQYVFLNPATDPSLEANLKSGSVVKAGDHYLRQQRIVFAGINVNQVGDLDLASQTFTADFFVWLKYAGDNKPTAITFLNAVDPSLSLGSPIKTTKIGNVTYALYRVKSTFQSPMEFRDFPFDKQQLPIEFANKSLPASELVFAIEPALLDATQKARLTSGLNGSVSINDIPNWDASRLEYYQGSIGSTALLGDPSATASTAGVEFSTFTADITIGRDLRSFLIKNLLPLVLLAVVTYVSLFFPVEDTATRVSFGITGILTAAVLMSDVTKSLPEVGYTVAIEWIFYAFIFLSALLILIGIVGQRLHRERRLTALAHLNVVARVVYPLFIVLVALVYWRRFG